METIESLKKEVSELKEALIQKDKALEALGTEFADFKKQAAEQVKKLKSETGKNEIIREPLAFKHKGKLYKFKYFKFSIGTESFDAKKIVEAPEEFADKIQKALEFGGFLEEIKA